MLHVPTDLVCGNSRCNPAHPNPVREAWSVISSCILSLRYVFILVEEAVCFLVGSEEGPHYCTTGRRMQFYSYKNSKWWLIQWSILGPEANPPRQLKVNSRIDVWTGRWRHYDVKKNPHWFARYMGAHFLINHILLSGWEINRENLSCFPQSREPYIWPNYHTYEN